ncbi:MAG: hypothetical protein M1837_003911 [Sclerophora amabilis]|nr:MAG: hypothetical protein M1837_003911 [Sclerophora amabilis]
MDEYAAFGDSHNPHNPHNEPDAPTTPNRVNGESVPSSHPRVGSASFTHLPARRIGSPLPSAPSGLDGSPAEPATSPQWSSAVGRATTGKSGRVIERLQAENDRLRRELKLESLRRDEEQKKGETARGMMEGLRVTNDNLAQITEVDKTSLLRKDRKLDELKSDLESERARRLQTEGQLKLVMKDSEKKEDELRSAAREDAERAKRAVSQYEVLSASWKHLEDGWKSKVERLQKDLLGLAQQGAEDRANLKRLTIISEHQKKEIERVHLAKEGVDNGLKNYKKEMDESTRTIRENAERNEAANAKVMEEAMALLGSMRHVIKVKENLRDTAEAR